MRGEKKKQTQRFDMQPCQKVYSLHLLWEGDTNTWCFPDQEGRSGKSQGVLGRIHLDVSSTETPKLPEERFQEERIELNARGSYRGEEDRSCFNKRNVTIREGEVGNSCCLSEILTGSNPKYGHAYTLFPNRRCSKRRIVCRMTYSPCITCS